MQSKEILLDNLGRPMKHGMHKSPENIAWRHMKDRCSNPKSQRFDRYGGRGISVCERWANSFEAFYEDLGPRPSSEHSIERIDNDGNYEPGNVIWALREQQENNKSTNVFLTHDGETLTLAQWSRKLGIEKKTLSHRLKAGWSVDLALTTPVEGRQWLRHPGKKIPEETKQQIIAERTAGTSVVEIVRRFGVSQTTVTKLTARPQPLTCLE